MENHEALSSVASQHTVYPITQPVHGVSFSANTDEHVIKSPCCYADGEILFGFSFGQTNRERTLSKHLLYVNIQPYSHREHQASKITVVTMVTMTHLKGDSVGKHEKKIALLADVNNRI